MFQAENPYNTAGSTYYYGFTTRIVKVDGTTATVDIAPPVSFTAETAVEYYDVSGFTIRNGTIDNSSAILVSGKPPYVFGVSVSGGVNTTIENMIFLGGEYAWGGLAIHGHNAVVNNVIVSNYFGLTPNDLGDLGGGRPAGYGITVYGNNVKIFNSSITNCKHCISVGQGNFISTNITIENNTLVQDNAYWGDTTDSNGGAVFQGIYDQHDNVNGVLVARNTMVSASQDAAILIRNGGGDFVGNKIVYMNDTTPFGIFRGGAAGSPGEAQTTKLNIVANEITASVANTPLFNPTYTSSTDVGGFRDHFVFNPATADSMARFTVEAARLIPLVRSSCSMSWKAASRRSLSPVILDSATARTLRVAASARTFPASLMKITRIGRRNVHALPSYGLRSNMVFSPFPPAIEYHIPIDGKRLCEEARPLRLSVSHVENTFPYQAECRLSLSFLDSISALGHPYGNNLRVGYNLLGHNHLLCFCSTSIPAEYIRKGKTLWRGRSTCSSFLPLLHHHQQ